MKQIKIKLNDFVITFGQKYRSERHPIWDKAHPDGYVIIQANTVEEARAKAFETFDKYWAFIYKKRDFNPERFPKGILGVF